MAKDSAKTNVTVDVNKAIEQGKDLATELWASFSEASTNVVVTLVNNTRYALKHRGGFQWQGKTTDAPGDIPAGGTGGWRIHSNGTDGSFSMQVWRAERPAAEGSPFFLTVGELVYMTGAQSRMTAELSGIDHYGDGSEASKEKALVLLDKGRSTGWTRDVTIPGSGGMAMFEIRTVITSKEGVANGVTYVVTVNQG